MSFGFWVQLSGGIAGLWLAFVEYRAHPERRVWLLLLVASIGFLIAALSNL